MISNDTLIGRRLGKYKIRDLIGKGGMGRVYLAKDERSNERVAIKHVPFTKYVRPTNPFFEARILTKLEHKNLPKVHKVFQDEDGFYLVMEYIPGETVYQLMKRHGTLPSQRAISYIMNILAVLDYLHRLNPAIIHRDIKPSNLKFHRNGRLMLVDFGIAKEFHPEEQTHVGAKGHLTRGYAPLEQYTGGTDARSDLFAVGGVFYYLLTGEDPPDVQEHVGKRHYHLDPREINPQVPDILGQIITRATAMKQDLRYKSAREMYQALKEARLLLTPPQEPVGEVLEGSAPYLREPPPSAPQRAQSILPMLLIVLLVTIIVSAAVLIMN
ncbi:MAG: serine/threonine protein kinase [Ardenticatenaceae bacterium]